MSEDRKRFDVWLNSEMTKHKDNVDMLNYYRRNEEYLRDGFINGAKIKDAELNKIMHYPECWDTAAYPTVLDAVTEVFECSECTPSQTSEFHPDWSMLEACRDGSKEKDAEIAGLRYAQQKNIKLKMDIIHAQRKDIEQLNKTLAYHSEKLTAVTRRHCDELDRNCELKKKLLHAGEIVSEKCKEIEQLNAKVAKQKKTLDAFDDLTDKLIAELKEQYTSLQTSYAAVWESRDYAEDYSDKCNKEIEQLNAKVAMMHKAVYELRRTYNGEFTFNETNKLFAFADEALTATEADVQSFINGVRADALEEVAKKYNTSHATLLPSTHEVADSLRELAQELRGE